MNRQDLEAELAERTATVDNLQREANALARELRELNSRTDIVKVRLREIVDTTFGGHGKLRRATWLVSETERKLADLSLPRVIWKADPFDGEWVVAKRTPKMIHVRKFGDTRVVRFKSDGTYPASYQKAAIDVEATFGKKEEGKCQQ